MATILEIASTNYEDDIFKIKRALSHLQTTCEITDGYLLSKPDSKFGWTFCQLLLKPAFSFNIKKKFADMIQKYEIDFFGFYRCCSFCTNSIFY